MADVTALAAARERREALDRLRLSSLKAYWAWFQKDPQLREYMESLYAEAHGYAAKRERPEGRHGA